VKEEARGALSGRDREAGRRKPISSKIESIVGEKLEVKAKGLDPKGVGLDRLEAAMQTTGDGPVADGATVSTPLKGSEMRVLAPFERLY
jgi:hypothetical protein